MVNAPLNGPSGTVRVTAMGRAVMLPIDPSRRLARGCQRGRGVDSFQHRGRVTGFDLTGRLAQGAEGTCGSGLVAQVAVGTRACDVVFRSPYGRGGKTGQAQGPDHHGGTGYIIAHEPNAICALRNRLSRVANGSIAAWMF